MEEVMKKMMKSFAAFTAATIFLVTASCAPVTGPEVSGPPAGKGVVNISLGTDEDPPVPARILLPGSVSSSAFTSYTLIFTPSAGNPVSLEDVTSLSGIVLNADTYSLNFTAYVGSGGSKVEAAVGSVTGISVSNGATTPVTVPLVFKPGAGNGTLSFTITRPGDFDLSNAQFVLSPLFDGGSSYGADWLDILYINYDEPGIPLNHSADITTIASGHYLATVTLFTPERRAAKSDIVHIGAGQTTTLNWSFSAGDFSTTVTQIWVVGVMNGWTLPGTPMTLALNGIFTWEGVIDTNDPAFKFSLTDTTGWGDPWNGNWFAPSITQTPDTRVTVNVGANKPMVFAPTNTSAASATQSAWKMNAPGYYRLLVNSAAKTFDIEEIVVVKEIDFEDREEFIRTSSTSNSPPAEMEAYDFQRGGTNSDLNIWSVLTGQNHTTTGSKSFKWGNVTLTDQKVKLDKIFTPADAGRTFNISLWVYSAAAAKVKLGAFSLSGTSPPTSYATNPKSQSPETSIPAGTWTEVVWNGYEYTQADADDLITQLGISQTGTVSPTLYLDDIVIKAADNGAWRVTFTGSPVPDLSVANNGTVTQPSDPARSGYTFDGWYGDSAFTSSFNFSTGITASRAIYAKWIPNLTATVEITGTPKEGQVITASVGGSGTTFYQWMRGDSPSGTFQNITGANSMTYTLDGNDVGKYIKVSITRTGYAGSVPSAAFGPILGAATPEYTVTFNTNGGSSISSVDVLQGGKVTRPSTDPVRDGYMFIDWYSDSAFTTVFDFTATTITAATTIHARWYVIVKKIVFDDLTNFKLTKSSSQTLAAKEVYEFQRGGSAGPLYGSYTDTATASDETKNNNGISSEQDHTTGTGKSFKWSNVTASGQRVKFEKAFSPADLGRTFKISVWVYSTAATPVRLGIYKLSGVSDDANYSNAPAYVDRAPEAVSLTANTWTELIWDNYTHTNEYATQIAVSTEGGTLSSSNPATFYIDDIVIAASEITETPVKNIDFELASFVEDTGWQAANWPNPNTGTPPVAAALSSDQAHGGEKSFKFSGRSGTNPQVDKNCAVKFYDVFPSTADNGMYNVTAWVYNPNSTEGNWVYLAVYAPDSSTVAAWQITRVEPGRWNKVELRGYKHTNGGNTQLGIAQPANANNLDTFYIDDIVVTKVQ
jgi:uncharacterized repeat protein (TIGR02543 family)